MEWGRTLERVPDFYIEQETLKIIQDYLFSGFHVLLSGSPGCGKTQFGKSWAKAYGVDSHQVNCGAIRSPRDWFGRWEYRDGLGTVFVPSKFIEMIERPSLLLLDEINRTTPDNHNPIMNILDGNREVFVEELNRHVRVHERTLFIATRNTGRQHTGTFHMDHALEDRFQEIRLHLPPETVMVDMLCGRYGLGRSDAETIAALTVRLNEMYEDEMLGKSMGLRPALAAGALVSRGNPLAVALKYAFALRYSDEGGPDGERTLVLQTIQGMVKADAMV